MPKSTAGDWLNARSSKDWSPWGVGGATGPPGRFGFIDSLFSLRASVGLMVLAPSPEMWCAVDCRLLADEEGVCVRCAGDLPGERVWPIESVVESGVDMGAARCAECCFVGG